ncbi:sensor histidine kinase [Caldalkalibacillus thermarum]|uniref:sensor histidine kinase n=1 Tax=Caldalkalibacillus thermarum TaxID=296745 RepID=UPI00166CFF9F|nr:ATP-binding protein [Caldalkalibacillus thermarum]
MNHELKSYQRIKWLILLIPTITVGIWELVRHTPYMLERLSMEAGNWLTPVIVFAVTMIFVRRLFQALETLQHKLEEEKTKKAMLEEREKLARQLHDGVAQSLFLLGVKCEQWQARVPELSGDQTYCHIRQLIRHIHDDVRQAIVSLRQGISVEEWPWTQSVHELIERFERESGLTVQLDWRLAEEHLSAKEKVELYACLQEALVNIHKHAQASMVNIEAYEEDGNWLCRVTDDGRGLSVNPPFESERGFGTKIMRDRAAEMGWTITWHSRETGTEVIIRKEGQGGKGDASKQRQSVKHPDRG